jgi:hypothetical protein
VLAQATAYAVRVGATTKTRPQLIAMKPPSHRHSHPDRHPLSPRLRRLRAILAKLRPETVREPDRSR